VHIGACDDGSSQKWLRTAPNLRELATYIGGCDLHQLLLRCIEVPDFRFAIAHGLSKNRFKRLELTSTRDLLRYEPQDGAFTIFTETLNDWLQV